jgi:hypothetical protein
MTRWPRAQRSQDLAEPAVETFCERVLPGTSWFLASAEHRIRITQFFHDLLWIVQPSFFLRHQSLLANLAQ